MAEKVWKFSLDIQTERKSEAQELYKDIIKFIDKRAKISSSPIYGTRKYKRKSHATS